MAPAIRSWLARAAAACVLVGGAGPAAGGVAGFRLSEVVTASPAGDPAARYVELEATADGCLFPSTVVVAYDAGGGVLGMAAPYAVTTCLPAGTFVLLATPAAQAAFMTGADAALVPPLPGAAGQVCLVSSTTRYDCVRWGAITGPVHDLFGSDDDSAATAPPAGLALARHGDTDVIAVDWQVESPTPRRANDGQPWDGDGGVDAPVDGGVDGPGDGGVDAAADGGGPIDGGIDAPIDGARPDANTRFLDLDPVGGGCACRSIGGARGAASGAASVGLVLVIGALLAISRRRRTGRANAPGTSSP